MCDVKKNILTFLIVLPNDWHTFSYFEWKKNKPSEMPWKESLDLLDQIYHCYPNYKVLKMLLRSFETWKYFLNSILLHLM